MCTLCILCWVVGCKHICFGTIEASYHKLKFVTTRVCKKIHLLHHLSNGRNNGMTKNKNKSGVTYDNQTQSNQDHALLSPQNRHPLNTHVYHN